jgi:hypothetical protein
VPRQHGTSCRYGASQFSATWSARGYAPRSHAAHVVASSQSAQAPWVNTPRQLRPWAGHGSGKTSQHCERLSVPITESHWRESARRKRGWQLNRRKPAVSRACKSGNRRHHGPNATGPSHGRVRRRASIWRHGGRPPMCPKTAGRRAMAPRGHIRVADAIPRRRRRSSHKAQ